MQREEDCGKTSCGKKTRKKTVKTSCGKQTGK
jgi:hypothetical protein